MRISAATLSALAFTSGLWAAESEELKRLATAAEALTEIQETPDKGIPTDLFHKAHCVIVIPSMKKAGFIVTGKYGRGYAFVVIPQVVVGSARQECELRAAGSDCKWAVPKPT